jgi:hypothetical protein
MMKRAAERVSTEIQTRDLLGVIAGRMALSSTDLMDSVFSSAARLSRSIQARLARAFKRNLEM